MTWDELSHEIAQLTRTQRRGKVVVFCYTRNRFFDPVLCFEGKPSVHLTIEDDDPST
jgi:hypothetical protein